MAKEYAAITRPEVLKRDSMLCFLCNKKGIQVHEVVPRSRFSKRDIDLCFSVKNRVCLCVVHHEQAHTFENRKVMLGLLQQKFGYRYDEQVFQKYFN